ncbi:MAG: HU family DNA-binding protein [Deltaproteobacteria bacterium]|nr:HU family DNA-binding protein [Deltaproteobacteria bacterium]
MSALPIVRYVATEAAITQPQAKLAIEAVFGHIQEQLKAGHNITIRGVGRFYLSNIRTRKGYNVYTRERTRIPASCSMRFRAARGWRDVVVEHYRKRQAK